MTEKPDAPKPVPPQDAEPVKAALKRLKPPPIDWDEADRLAADPIPGTPDMCVEWTDAAKVNAARAYLYLRAKVKRLIKSRPKKYFPRSKSKACNTKK